MKHSIKWGDKTVVFYFYADYFKKRRIVRRSEICAICKQPITEGDIWLIISNQVGVPNRQVHGECFTGFEETFEKIVEDYERAKIHFEWLEHSGWLTSIMGL